MRDANEEAIAGQMISLNGNLFMSNENGEIFFKNVEATNFKADFSYSSKIKGWSPAAGTIQKFETTGDNTEYIPFRPSKVLQGKLTLVADSLSDNKFSMGSIKITVTSTDNTSYSTLTDEDGNFYFNLPTDNYVVTLSEAAFDEHFRPSQLSQRVDLTNNSTKNVYFEIRQRKDKSTLSSNKNPLGDVLYSCPINYSITAIDPSICSKGKKTPGKTNRQEQKISRFLAPFQIRQGDNQTTFY